jgi:hypothetical protein
MDLWQKVGLVRVKGTGAVGVERLLDFSVPLQACIGEASSNPGERLVFWLEEK